MRPELRAIYDQVPGLACKGLCLDACTAIPTADCERAAIAELTGRRVRTGETISQPNTQPVVKLLRIDDDHCHYLRKGRCSIYEARPLICRLYGVAEGLPCTHGCQPAVPLTQSAASALLRKLNTLK